MDRMGVVINNGDQMSLRFQLDGIQERERESRRSGLDVEISQW